LFQIDCPNTASREGNSFRLEAERHSPQRCRTDTWPWPFARIVYPELDLAYAINGPVYRLDCITTELDVRMRIEHDSMAHTDICVDACARNGNRREAIVTAWDDGEHVVVPSRPRHYKRVLDDRVLIDELSHFLNCLRTGETPCNTVADAEYLLSLALRTRSGVNVHA
jgi:hypothetical protein